MTPREGLLKSTVAVTSAYPGRGGGAIFFGVDAEGRSSHYIANHDVISGAPQEGEIWTVEGAWERHPTHGPQVRVARALRVNPAGIHVVHYLTRNKAFKGIGIGARKAERLWKEFGEELYTLLTRGDVEKLSQVITPGAAGKLVEAWKKDSEEREVLNLLANYGFDQRLAKKLLAVWGKEAAEKVRENPYRMLAFTGWKKVDRAAQSLGVARDDARRQAAAVEAFLYQRLDAKHTVTPHGDAVEGVSSILGTRDRREAQAAIDRALSAHAIASHDAGYQPRGAAFMEHFLRDRFRAMIGGATSRQRSLFSISLGAVISDTVSKFEQEQGIKLNAEQRAAVEMAVSQPLGVLTGGAGVGKTTALRVINEICERTGTVVRQMALSGRAAQRMREATGREATTIAKFLHESAESRGDARGEPLVIIDECSMLDLSLLYSVVRVLPPGARLLLVGDPYQLPPIGFGLVFHVLAGSPDVPRVELVEVHRQAQSTGIPQAAHSVRHGVVPRLPPFGGPAYGVYFIEAGEAEVPDRLRRVVDQMRGCEDVQILGVTKRGASGVVNINRIFHSLHLASSDPVPKNLLGWDIAEGDPVIYLANDYNEELWNGSLGRVEKVGGNSARDGGRPACSLFCVFDGVEHEIAEDDLHNLALAYAVTVHKAQGSQFRRVVMPVVRSRLLDRSLLYTGITRAIEQVVLVGDRAELERAVKSPMRSQGRMVGFSV
jgi:exodeoxyribonuclease V alpha subunit